MDYPIKNLEQLLKKIEEKKPLIHCLTNEVTVNDVANSILSLGGSPIMAHHLEEVYEITSLADALVINLGATEYLDQIFISSKVDGVKKIFDPVGVGASTFRRKKALDLLEISKFDAIRGNYSEILALYEDKQTTRGVDASEESKISQVKEAVINLSKRTGAIVISSGKVDFISDGKSLVEIHNGSYLMSKVTGTGCMSTGLLACFLSVEDSLESMVLACLYIALSSELAERKMKEEKLGLSSFKAAFIDNLFKVSKDLKELEGLENITISS